MFQLSFVRRKDFHILSNGHTLFTNDPRIEIIHRAKTIDWILRIKQASFQDSGNYDCQVRKKKNYTGIALVKVIESGLAPLRKRLVQNGQKCIGINTSVESLSTRTEAFDPWKATNL